MGLASVLLSAGTNLVPPQGGRDAVAGLML